MTTRILLAEDIKLVAEAFEALLSVEPEFEVVARVARGDDLVTSATRLFPDVILADYHLENGDTGVHAIAALRQGAGQPIPAVMITAHRDPQIARSCAAMQVHLMEKPVRPTELAEMLGGILA